MSDRLTPVLAAVRARVEGRGFSIDGVALPVMERQAETRRQTLDPKCMITVAKSATAERTSRRRFGLWQTEYDVDVVLHAPHTGPDDAARTRLYSSMRDTIVDLFKSVPLPGAPEVFEMDCQAADWLRPTGTVTDWDWWACRIVATVAHA